MTKPAFNCWVVLAACTALTVCIAMALWQTRLGSQVFGGAVTYSVNGRQYIAVAAGGGYNGGAASATPDIDQPAGANMVYVFALP